MITIFGTGQSSKLLAKALGIKRNNRKADVVIRWKTVEPFGRAFMINDLVSVKNASHKYLSLQLMKDAGLSVPKFTKLWQVVVDDIDLNPRHIWFGRNNYHTQGRDIKVYNREAIDTELDESARCATYEQDYYIQYMKPKAEYRYHVAFGKVILPTKKVLAEGETDESLIRNHQNGKWLQVVCRETERFSAACICAVKAHGLDFGAVDFLNIDGEPYILEVNTAPGLQVQNRLDVYTKAFKNYFLAKGYV